MAPHLTARRPVLGARPSPTLQRPLTGRRPPPAAAALVDPPGGGAPTSPPPPLSLARLAPDPAALRQALLAAAAGLDRGRDASPSERAAVERAAVALEEAGAAAAASSPSSRQTPPLAAAPGRWRLAYASCQPFRSSPFFWGFSATLGQALADPIFAFTDAIPGAEVGAARQTISLHGEDGGGLLTSSVRLTVGVGLSGDVVTTARLVRVPGPDGDASPTDLDVVPLETRVEGSRLPFVGRAAVPVGTLFGALRKGGGGAQPSVRLRMTYCDELVRVARVEGEGLLFVYVRE